MTSPPHTFVFALTPMDRAFDDVYELGIKGACGGVEAYCERVDGESHEGKITDRIHNLIHKADIVVAEMSTRDPDVFYEAGYAHALGKPVILLTRDARDIPFDLKQYPHIVYGESVSQLKADLTRRLEWVIRHPDRNPTEARFPLSLFLNGEALEASAVAEVPMKPVTTGGGDGIILKLDFYNPTQRPFSGDCSIAVVTEDLETNDSDAKTAQLPDGKFIHVTQRRLRLLPESWESVEWVLRTPLTLYQWDTEFDLEVIVFTELQRLEYPVRVRGTRFPQ